MAKAGRKSLCTKARIESICASIRKGATYKIAAQGAGISERCFHRWMQRADEEPNSNYALMKKEIYKAELECADYLLDIIKAAAIKDWKPAAWLLERRYNYRRDQRHEFKTEKKTVLPKEPKELLKLQMEDLKGAIQSARASESWQAYAALQRQMLKCIQDLKQLNAEDGTEELTELTDEQLIQEITGAVVSLPPVLRQQLEANILEFTNVIQMKR
jgi:hypothetical protein